MTRLMGALTGADLPRFLLLMVPNSVLYFAWDTFLLAVVIRWFHGPVRYAELLPVRAASYVVALAQTQVAQFTLAYYLKRKLRAPFLRLAGTVLFLTLTEITHLMLWAVAGMIAFRERMPPGLFYIPAALAAFWCLFLLYLRWEDVRAAFHRPKGAGKDPIGWDWWRVRDWEILQTFVRAPVKRYAQWIALRAPLFFISLVFHYFAVGSFGIAIPFSQMLAFLPIIFVIGAVPVTVGRLGTTQAAWIFFFSAYAAPEKLLAYSLASHLAFLLCRGVLGLLFLPRAYRELVGMAEIPESARA